MGRRRMHGQMLLVRPPSDSDCGGTTNSKMTRSTPPGGSHELTQSRNVDGVAPGWPALYAACPGCGHVALIHSSSTRRKPRPGAPRWCRAVHGGAPQHAAAAPAPRPPEWAPALSVLRLPPPSVAEQPPPFLVMDEPKPTMVTGSRASSFAKSGASESEPAVLPLTTPARRRADGTAKENSDMFASLASCFQLLGCIYEIMCTWLVCTASAWSPARTSELPPARPPSTSECIAERVQAALPALTNQLRGAAGMPDQMLVRWVWDAGKCFRHIISMKPHTESYEIGAALATPWAHGLTRTGVTDAMRSQRPQQRRSATEAHGRRTALVWRSGAGPPAAAVRARPSRARLARAVAAAAC